MQSRLPPITDVAEANSERPVRGIASGIGLMFGLLAAFTAYTVIPFGPSLAVTDMNIGIVFVLGAMLLAVLGIVGIEWTSNSHQWQHDSPIGVLRLGAHIASYEIAMGVSAISAILMTSMQGKGTLSMIGIVQAQQEEHIWFIFKFFPLGLVAFAIFYISALQLSSTISGAPLNGNDIQPEMTAGYRVGGENPRWSLLMLVEYTI